MAAPPQQERASATSSAGSILVQDTTIITSSITTTNSAIAAKYSAPSPPDGFQPKLPKRFQLILRRTIQFIVVVFVDRIEKQKRR